MTRQPTRRERWESASEGPLTAMAIAFLVAYAVPILDVHLSRDWSRFYGVVTWVSWATFAIDYLLRLVLSRSRLRFVRRHPLDLAFVVLPMLRPLRALRVLAQVNVLGRHGGTTLRGRVGVYVTGSMALLLFIGSLAVLAAERNAPGSNIHTFGDALWWSIVTASTVGYGDFYPVTTTGRCIGVGMMIAGIALLGIVTGSVATWFVSKVRVPTSSRTATAADIEVLTARIEDLQRQLGAQAQPVPPTPARCADSRAAVDPEQA